MLLSMPLLKLSPDIALILVQLGAAWLAGIVIGLERSVRSRPAGFRTHALVGLASALLMVVSTHQSEWVGSGIIGNVTTDPTRMAQGIMTGIGFLGAGVIFKDGLSVRGLTTAASIWITATLGILYGIGFFVPAIVGTLATLGTLSLLHWLERYIPTEYYAELTLRYRLPQAPNEDEIGRILSQHGFSFGHMSYHRDAANSGFLQYDVVIQSRRAKDVKAFVQALQEDDRVIEFRLMPRGD